MAAFRRPAYSSVIFHLRNSGALPESIKTRLEKDPRLTVEIKRENEILCRTVGKMMAKFCGSSA